MNTSKLSILIVIVGKPEKYSVGKTRLDNIKMGLGERG
jgi:hypothetical protein